jgi:hypothetical protein
MPAVVPAIRLPGHGSLIGFGDRADSNDASVTLFRDQRREGEPPVLVLPSPIFFFKCFVFILLKKNAKCKILRSIDLLSYVMCFCQGTPVVGIL